MDLRVGSCGLLADMPPKLHLRSQKINGGNPSGGIAFAYDATDACLPFGLPRFLGLSGYIVQNMIKCPPLGLKINGLADDQCALIPRNIPREGLWDSFGVSKPIREVGLAACGGPSGSESQ